MYDFEKVEESARKVWEKNKKEIEKSLYDRKGKLFSFLEGPPTANAPPGLHHLEVRTYKDLICKFKFMQGFSVPRKGGWDCHGLPVEVQIEKKAGLNSKKDIEKYGIARFTRECRESVFSYIKDWEKSTEELNFLIDLKNPYRTLDNEYIESVWWSLKELYKKKLLYEDNKVVPFCPRCETPLSSHELAQGYKKIKEETIVVRFKLESGENILVWTTTPWTLPANLALAVNPKFDYAIIKTKEEKYILAKELVNKFFSEAKIIKTIKGKELVGKKYKPLFDYFKNLKNSFKIIPGNFVELTEGTGIVHMAPAFGEVDFEACKEYKIDFVNPVNTNGKFTSEIPELEGKFIKAADAKIIEKLEKENKLFTKLDYEHDYPYCWRCDSPLMYYAIKSWFIRTTKFKKEMIKLNKQINWVPDYIKEGRFGDWLDNLKDWALSRSKFWGTPLPIWRCECGEEKIIGSINELEKLAGKKIKELHKPEIDLIKLKCKCGKEMSRVPDVIDCWYDSGSASFAQFHYPFENKQYFNQRFPYDFIAEAIDQTRGWFYTLHAIAVMLFEKPAYKNVICAGHIVDEKGDKMSKTKGNMISPRKMFDEVGVDAVRLQFCSSDVGNQKRFSVNLVNEAVMPFLTILANLNEYYNQSGSGKEKIQIEDNWIISKLNSTIKKVTEFLEKYDINDAYSEINNFVVNDLSRTYIKMTRDRNTKKILAECLEKVALILAPFVPHISEYIYLNFNKKSVHLSSWPKSGKINKKLEAEMETTLKIIEVGLAERDKAQIGLKWPLSMAEIALDNKISGEFIEIIKRQLNVKQVKLNLDKKSKEAKVKLDTTITPELEAEGFAREISRAIQAGRKKAGLVKTDKIILEIISDENTVEKLEKWEDFIKERTNSKKISIDYKTPQQKGHFAKVIIRNREFNIRFSKT